MKLIGEMAKGKKKFDAAKAAAAARDLSKSTQKIPDLFPEGSNGHPSDALDAVWKEWDRFRAMPMTRKPPPMRWPRLSRPRARIGRSPSRK
jgi:cytochrome c556